MIAYLDARSRVARVARARHARSRSACAFMVAPVGRRRARQAARRARLVSLSRRRRAAVGLVSCRCRVARCPHVPHVAAPLRTRRVVSCPVVAPATRRHLARHVRRCRRICRRVRALPTRAHSFPHVRQCAAIVGLDSAEKRKRSRYLRTWYRHCITLSRFRGAACGVAKTSHAVSWRENAPRNAAKLSGALVPFSRFRKNAFIPGGYSGF